MGSRATLAVLSALLWGLAFGQVDGVTDGVIRVDAGRDLGEISPFVYGANFGPLGVITVDLFDEAEASGVTFLRFPGGRWGDLNSLTHFDVDTLMRVARLIGAEPSIHVRLENGTPEAAAALVRYANIERDYDVRYWYIGNEPSLFDDYSVERLNREWRAIALAMLEVDPDITLIGPEPHQWNGTPAVDPRDPDGREWVRGFLEANGDLVDIVAVHRYPFPRSAGSPDTTIADLRENAAEWGEILPRLERLARETTGRDDLRFAVTEANSHWSATIGGEATNDSRFNAIWWADALGKLIEDGASIVAYFDLQSSDGRGGWGLLANDGPRPSYYVYQLYGRFGRTLLAAETTLPHVSAYAARRDDGALTLIVTNLNDEPRRVALELTGVPDPTVSEALLLDAEHDAEAVEPALEEGTLDLPGRSVTLLVFGGAAE